MSLFAEGLSKENLDNRIIKMRAEAESLGVPTIDRRSLNLLLILVGAKQPQRILEIGTAYGCSGSAMLLSAPKAHLTTIEKDAISADKARENFAFMGLTERVDLFEGDASEIVPMLGGSYDFIFLDGPKGHYAEYLPYLTALLPVGGMLVADDVLFWGYVEKDELPNRKHGAIYRSLRSFLETISSDERFVTELIEMEDGMSVSIKIK